MLWSFWLFLLVVCLCSFGCLFVCFWLYFCLIAVVLLVVPFGCLFVRLWLSFCVLLVVLLVVCVSFWWSFWLSCVLEKATQGKKEPRHHNFHENEEMTSGWVLLTLTTFLLKSNIQFRKAAFDFAEFFGELVKGAYPGENICSDDSRGSYFSV